MTVNDENFLIQGYFSDTTTNQIITNRNITGQDIKAMALNSNHIIGKGNNKVCLSNIADSTTGTQTRYYKIMDHMSPNITEQYVVLDVSASSAAKEIDVYLESQYYITPSSNFLNLSLNSSGESCAFGAVSMNPIGLDITPGTTHSIDLVLTYVGNSGQLKINSFALYDSPARYRNPTDTLSQDMIATDVYSCNVGMPIFTVDGNKQNSSIAGIVRNINAFSSSLSYKNIYSIVDAYKIDTTLDFSPRGIYATNTSQINYYNGLNRVQPLVFATQTDLTQTQKECIVWAYGAVQVAGVTGSLHISSSVDNVRMTITASTPTWVSASLKIPTENCTYHQYGTMPSLLNEVYGNLSLSSSLSAPGDFRVWTVQIYEKL